MSLFPFLYQVSSMNIIDTIDNNTKKKKKKKPKQYMPKVEKRCIGSLRPHLANNWTEG